MPLGSGSFLFLQSLGKQALTQARKQGLPVGWVGFDGQLQLQTGLIGTLGLGPEPQPERRLPEHPQLGGAQAIVFLQGLTDQAATQQSVH